MTSWYIIRCERHHDAKVAQVIRAEGWDVWMPQQLVITRHPGARRHTDKTRIISEKWLPLIPNTLFSPILALPDALHETGRYPCSLWMAAPYRPAAIAFETLRWFMDEIEAENQETIRRNTPRGPAIRKKERWRDLKSGLSELLASAGALEEAA